MTRLRVPLAVDAQVRIPVGPAVLPLRAVVLLVAASPVAFVCLQLSALDVSYRIGVALAVFMGAFSAALPEREGVWIGTWCLYRMLRPLLPTTVVDGSPRRAVVRACDTGMVVSRIRPPLAALERVPYLTGVVRLPAVTAPEPGVIRLRPGGARAVLLLEGPQGSITGDAYASWSRRAVEWLLAVDCPAQLLTVVSHHDGHRARLAYDRATEGWRRSPLWEFERSLCEAVAEQSLGLRHHVVFSPALAGPDGIPHTCSLRTPHLTETPDAEAARVLRLAQRLAAGVGISVSVPDRDDIAALLRQTLLGTSDAAADPGGVLRLGDQHQVMVAATKLPSVVHPAMVVEALIRARARGVATLHVLPVATSVVRTTLDRRLALQRYSAREGNTAVDNQVAAADTTETLAAIARRDLQPCRVALTFGLMGDDRRGALENAERVRGLLAGHGFETIVATTPGLLPAVAASPGAAPLRRSLLLTSDGVAACLVPVLGTPFLDMREPLVGVSELTGAPVYASVWTRPNHNAIIVGSSGAGKSVTAKTLLVRHVVQGASAVVIDPDSEYRRVMTSIGGTHLELGDDALNPLGPASMFAPDIAAGLVLPVLSVMAGDEKGVRDGRPIRRLPDEDLGWLHDQLATFFRSRHRDAGPEPVLSELLAFLDARAPDTALSTREGDRYRVIGARLSRFVRGDQAAIFDRPSTFAVGTSPIAIGLRELSLAYGSDLTPALAVVLTAVLAALRARQTRLLVVVDEAHRVTSDPDAGDVLGRLVRQARKYGAGVWMCSQRVDDFVGSDLGRTLAATAATKIVLGVEEPALPGARDAFGLTDEETAAVCPPVTGRAVLLSGADRAVISVLAGDAMLAVASTAAGADRATTTRTGR